ncbi:MAG: DUF1735 domain-containing protein [Niabella sp.]
MKQIFYFLFVLSFSIASCNKEVKLQDSNNGDDKVNAGKVEFYNKTYPTEKETIIEEDGAYTFTFKTSVATQKSETLSIDKSGWDILLKDYNTFMQSTEYKILPDANFEAESVQLAQGAISSDITLKIKGMDALTQGYYVLPLKLNYEGESVLHIVKVVKDASYVALSDTNKKSMPPGTYNCPDRTEPMKMVAYVETNNWDIRNMGQFVLKNSRKPVFDYVVIFAANMNYDLSKKKRYLFFNDKLQPLVRDPKRFIKPLTDRGMKVIVDILPNHQGVGFFNFQSYEDALDFARECKEWADKLGIDGFDIDEEYADYNVRPELPQKGTQSTFWFMRAMKEVMPDKLLTLYDYGHNLSASSRDELGKGPVDYLDFSWSDYNVTGASRVGMPANRYGNRSLEASRNAYFDSPTIYATTIRNAAQNNINACNGYHMIFNLKGTSVKNGNAAIGLSYMTQIFYGEDTEFAGSYYPGPND